MGPEPPEGYETIPLPPQEHSGQEGEKRKKRTRHPFLRRAMFVLFAFAATAFVAGLVAAVAIYGHYSQRALTFPLEKVIRIERGGMALDRNGRQIGRVLVQNREFVSLEEVPPHLIEALIATEDARFYSHNGFDWRGIARAAWRNVTALRIEEGGSTISQQLARHVYGLRGRNFDRKFTELFLARRIEKAFGKDQIMESYLNRMYLGQGFWGIGAAAKGYFGKDVRDLTVEEAAVLCGIIKSPNYYSPFVDEKLALRVRNLTLGRMQAEGYLTAEEATALKASPLEMLPEDSRQQKPHYILGRIRREALDLLSEKDRTRDGLIIETSIDLDLQRRIRSALIDRLNMIESLPQYEGPTYDEYHPGKEAGGPQYLQGAIVIMDNTTGEILASAGGRDYQDSQYDRAFLARRAAGTAFAPFVYVTAFASEDVSPLSQVLDTPIDNRKVMIGGREGILGEWGAEYAGTPYRGEVTAAYGLLWSKNAATVRMGNRAGLDKVKQLVNDAGIHSPLRDFPTTYLGSSAVTLVELTQAYSIFPNAGQAIKQPVTVRRILTEDGEVLYERPASHENRESVIDPLAAHQVHQILRSSLENGTAFDAKDLGLENPHAAGKTGTAYHFTDGWFIGYDGGISCGVWVGRDDAKPIFEGAFSRDVTMPLWIDCMNAAARSGFEPAEVRPPKGVQNSEPISLCLRTGLRATKACREAGPDGRVMSTAVSLTLDAETTAELNLVDCEGHDPGETPQSMTQREAAPTGDETKAWDDRGRAMPAARVAAVKPKSPAVIGPNPFMLSRSEAE